MNKEKIMEGVKLILEGIGEDVNREGLIETPDRIARMYMEIFEGLGKDAKEVLSKTFSVENNDLVLEKDITFFSMCEQHGWVTPSTQGLKGINSYTASYWCLVYSEDTSISKIECWSDTNHKRLSSTKKKNKLPFQRHKARTKSKFNE